MSHLEYEKDLYETRNDLVKEISLLSYDDFNNRCDRRMEKIKVLLDVRD